MDINQSFYKVFHNKFILKQIFYYLRLYNNHYFNRQIVCDNLSNYKYIEYITNLSVDLNYNQINEEHEPFSRLQLKSLKTLQINSTKFENQFVFQSLEKLTFNVVQDQTHYQIDKNFFLKFKNLKTINLGFIFMQGLDTINLPTTITSINFKRSTFFNNQIKGLLPTSLKVLKISDIKPVIEIDTFKNHFGNLVKLHLGPRFDQIILVGMLPSCLESLNLGNNYNKPFIKDALPTALKSLVIGNYFDQKIKCGDLPNSITSLSIGDSFKKGFQLNSIPSELKELELNYKFDQSFKQPLPNSLTRCTFGHNFRSNIKSNYYPNKLTELYFSNNDDHIHYTNNASTSIDILKSIFSPPKRQLPPKSIESLTKLSICLLQNHSEIPTSVKTLILYELDEDLYKKYVDNPNLQIKQIKFPIPVTVDHLIYLSLNYQIHDESLYKSSIKVLEFGTFYSNRLPYVTYYPTTLTTLYLSDNYSIKIPVNSLPGTLKNLYFGKNNLYNGTETYPKIGYQHSLVGVLPPLEILHLPFYYDIPLLEIQLPNSLTELRISSGPNTFQQTVSSDRLPSNLKKLIIFGNPIIIDLPSSLTSIQVYNTNFEFIHQFFSNDHLTNYYLNILNVIKLNKNVW